MFFPKAPSTKQEVSSNSQCSKWKWDEWKLFWVQLSLLSILSHHVSNHDNVFILRKFILACDLQWKICSWWCTCVKKRVAITGQRINLLLSNTFLVCCIILKYFQGHLAWLGLECFLIVHNVQSPKIEWIGMCLSVLEQKIIGTMILFFSFTRNMSKACQRVLFQQRNTKSSLLVHSDFLPLWLNFESR